jgi:formiminoglutamase
MKTYFPPKQEIYSGRTDEEKKERIYQLIHLSNLNAIPSKTQTLAIALLGFATDIGVQRNNGRKGAAKGPFAFRKSLANLPFSKEFPSLTDFGDFGCLDDDLEKAQSRYGDGIQSLIHKGYFPCGIGGGHEISWAFFQGLSKAYPRQSIGIINFDAHFDLRPLTIEGKGTSGTSFTQISEFLKEKELPFKYACVGIQPRGNTLSLFDEAKKRGVSYLLAEELYQKGPNVTIQFLSSFISGLDKIYLTIDLDVFQSAIAPGVSAPQPLGIDPRMVLTSLRLLASSTKLIGFDIAELNPFFDQDGHTARLAAFLALEIFDTLRLP